MAFFIAVYYFNRKNTGRKLIVFKNLFLYKALQLDIVAVFTVVYLHLRTLALVFHTRKKNQVLIKT